jgi:hypothetical protein
MRHIEVAQVPILLAQQRHQVRWSIALCILRPFALLGEQALLYFSSPGVRPA